TSDPGYVDLSPARGVGAFAVATFNAGIAGTFTVSADTGAANLPVTFTLCQTNPQSGACLVTPTPTVAVTINAATPIPSVSSSPPPARSPTCPRSTAPSCASPTPAAPCAAQPRSR